jgi:hypothetical protein
MNKHSQAGVLGPNAEEFPLSALISVTQATVAAFQKLPVRSGPKSRRRHPIIIW